MRISKLSHFFTLAVLFNRPRFYHFSQAQYTITTTQRQWRREEVGVQKVRKPQPTTSFAKKKNNYNKRRQLSYKTVRSSCPRCTEKGLSLNRQKRKKNTTTGKQTGNPFLSATPPKNAKTRGRTAAQWGHPG